jgi:hypothetical protein|eukprot:CAMPEP_0181215136 /NCGR_PEP_ID=MMETSP1096-20121128/25846_1 /TAXON_ID=156174 ORGANISM="Chrysochromulina ericina, Strain CCMP281" /NCGR_SAMPLE_ID=MMETSP1096 /ASSEMBLY_ACC=CAM_ASM_000453 /LENGTH=58 /DNA_ID=CAMNT_0023306959 /DNA_START=21 /DNA_END=197 /DNA_ORIENTATION=+
MRKVYGRAVDSPADGARWCLAEAVTGKYGLPLRLSDDLDAKRKPANPDEAINEADDEA